MTTNQVIHKLMWTTVDKTLWTTRPTTFPPAGRGGVGPARKGRGCGTPAHNFYFLFFIF